MEENTNNGIHVKEISTTPCYVAIYKENCGIIYQEGDSVKAKQLNMEKFRCYQYIQDMPDIFTDILSNFDIYKVNISDIIDDMPNFYTDCDAISIIAKIEVSDIPFIIKEEKGKHVKERNSPTSALIATNYLSNNDITLYDDIAEFSNTGFGSVIKTDDNSKDIKNIINKGEDSLYTSKVRSNLTNNANGFIYINESSHSNIVNTGTGSVLYNNGTRSTVSNNASYSICYNSKEAENSIIANTGNDCFIESTAPFSIIADTGGYSNIRVSDEGVIAVSTGCNTKIEVLSSDALGICTCNDSKIKGCLGAWLTFVEYKQSPVNSEAHAIKEVKTVMVDGVLIQPDTYYIMEDGIIKEVKL